MSHPLRQLLFSGIKISNMQTKKIQETLEKELKTLEEEIRELAESDPTKEPSYDIENDLDEDSAEGEEILRFNSLMQNLEKRKQQITSALKGIEDRTYGICNHCRKPIYKKRLKAIPYALNCLECQSKEDQKEEISNA